MNNIYTTYLAKSKHLPKDITKIYICRYLPQSLKLEPNDIHLKQLSPNPQILQMYKFKNITFDKLIELFLKEINCKENACLRASLRRLEVEDVCLICYEKDVNTCHRKYAAEFMADVTGGIYKGEYKYED